jgi:hypothetical protein
MLYKAFNPGQGTPGLVIKNEAGSGWKQVSIARCQRFYGRQGESNIM